MTDYDPNRDFRDPNRMSNTPDWEAEREANASWGWILGGLAAVALVRARRSPREQGPAVLSATR